MNRDRSAFLAQLLLFVPALMISDQFLLHEEYLFLRVGRMPYPSFMGWLFVFSPIFLWVAHVGAKTRSAADMAFLSVGGGIVASVYRSTASIFDANVYLEPFRFKPWDPAAPVRFWTVRLLVICALLFIGLSISRLAAHLAGKLRPARGDGTLNRGGGPGPFDESRKSKGSTGRVASWVYVFSSAAALAAVVLCLFENKGDSLKAFNFRHWMLYGMLPLAVVGFALGITRRRSPASPLLEVTVAALWGASLYAALSPLIMGNWAAWGMWVYPFAVLFGVASIALAGLAAYSLVGRQDSGSAPWAWRFLQAIGTGAIAWYLGHVSQNWYAGTLDSSSGGIGAMYSEEVLRVILSALSVLALAGSVLAGELGRGRPAHPPR